MVYVSYSHRIIVDCDFIRWLSGFEQKQLKEVFKKLDKKGCKVMLSNSDTKFIKDLYKDYQIKKVKATRMINCDGSNRGKINEVIVTNYKPKEEQRSL